MESETNRIIEFCEYFEELERNNIGYSLGDLKRKADELGLPVPDEDYPHLMSLQKGFKKTAEADV